MLAFNRLGGQGWSATPSEGPFVFQAYQNGVDMVDSLLIALWSNESKFMVYKCSHRQVLPKWTDDRFIIVQTGDLERRSCRNERTIVSLIYFIVVMGCSRLIYYRAIIDARLAMRLTEGQALFVGFVHEDIQKKILFKPISIRDPEKLKHRIGDINDISDRVRINVVIPK